MRHQAILYDRETGRIRQVLDPERDTTPEEVLALLNPEPHEAVLAYPKQAGANRYHEWQEHVTRHTGKMPADLHHSIREHVHSKVAEVTET